MSTLLSDAGGAILTLAGLLPALWLVAGLDRLFAGVRAGEGWRAAAFGEAPRAALRLLFKEFRSTEQPDRVLWLAGPVLLLALVMAALALLPLAPAAVDPPAGLVYLGAVLAAPALAVFLTAWGPNSKHALMAGYRAIGLWLALLPAFLLALAAAALPAASLRLGDVVAAQQAGLWNLWLQPLGFLLYLVCGIGIAFRGPPRTADGADQAGGVELELGGRALLLWRLGHSALLLTVAAFAVPLFLGGGEGPLLPAPAWSLLKTAAVAALTVALPHWLPSLPLERVMRLGWTVLIPAALLNLILVGLILHLPDAPLGGVA